MAGGSRPAEAPRKTLDLLPLAVARPREALARARAVLADAPGPWDASVARQVVGIVLRDFGDVNAAIKELRTALRLAEAAHSTERQADVLATLGTALVFAGRTSPGLASLDSAVAKASGVTAGRVLTRRGGVLLVLGRHRQALSDLRRAVTVLRRAGDTMWEARALSHLALTQLALGSTERADAAFGTAERLFAETNQELESVYATHNRGLVAFRSGDLPLALSHFDEAARRYEALDAPMPDLSLDRCALLLTAGLPGDALKEADLAIGAVERAGGQATKRADLLLTAADAALSFGDPATALRRARAAHKMFGAQQRAWWHARAALVLLQARHAGGLASVRLLRDAERSAARLDALGSDDALQARLLAGRVALALGRAQDADRNLAAVAGIRRRRGPALSRVNGWLAEALRAEAAGRSRSLLSACRRGSDLLEEYLITFGASELRAQATARGAELAELAQRHALRSGNPRLLLEWSERWRATALAVPPVLPVDDHELRADLAAVRDVTSRLEKARADGAPAAALQREQLRLESAIRARALRARGAGKLSPAQTAPPRPGLSYSGGPAPDGPQAGGPGPAAGADDHVDAAGLLGELGTATRLVEIVDVGGQLHVLVCGVGRIRHFPAGRAADAAREVDFARFGLNRLAHGRHRHDGRADEPGAALAVLDQTGRRLEDILLGGASRQLGDGPVVVVPPGRLHAVPWALLPALRGRVVSVAPSARAWLRARAAPPPERHDVVLVRGPGEGDWGAEVPALAAEYPDAAVLGGLGGPAGTGATATGVLHAIDGAGLVHVAAHGTFRADSPLFSSLRMDDGPLTVYDFERLRRAPHHMILPSCDSGLLAPAGADELLGLASTLVPLGTVGIVASVVRVNDKAAADLMLALHRRIRTGGTLGESLRDARTDVGDDPVATATGWSFIVLGAG